MTELTPAPRSGWENGYYEDAEVYFQEQGILIQGGIYNSRTLQDALWNKQRLENRARNISLAQGRVNGQYIQNGNKR